MIAALSTTFVSSPAEALTPKPGSTCSNVGQVVESKGKRFTCIKSGLKKVWNKGVAIRVQPKITPAPSTVDTRNPVHIRISQMLAETATPPSSTPPKVEWIAAPDLPAEKLRDLETQHQRLSDAFPETYVWSNTALGVVASDPTTIRVRLEQERCPSGFIDSVKRLEADSKLPGAGTSYCMGRFTAYFLTRNVSNFNWDSIVGNEFGSVIQENSTKYSPLAKRSEANWYPATPTWYSEGGQVILSAIAEAKATKKWNLDVKKDGAFGGNYCKADTLKEAKCGGFIGIVALELATALYGWDASLRLYKYLDLNQKQSDLFEMGFPDSFEEFNNWTVAYLKYLDSGQKLPAELIKRLS